MANTKKENDRLYYLRHKKDIREQQKTYWSTYKHTVNRKDSYTKFNQSPKGFYKTLKSNSRIKGREFNLSQIDFLNWYKEQPRICFYCDIPEIELINHPIFMRLLKSKELVSRLSIDRMDNDLPYKIGNIVLACRLCNSVKNNVFSSQEMKEISMKYLKPKWKK